jgi:hypothetical protein
MRINPRTYSNVVYTSLVFVLREVSSFNFTITQIQQVNLQQLTQTTTQTEIVILALTWQENTTF